MAKKKTKKPTRTTTRKPARKPAKKAPARKAKAPVRKARAKATARKVTRPARKAKPALRKAASPKKAARKIVKKRVVKKAVAKKAPAKARGAAKPAAPRRPSPKPAAKAPVAAARKPAGLNRERRRLAEVEAAGFTGMSDDDRLLSSARSGHDELRSELQKHTEASPELTAGDVDARWQDAYAVGDEAPGGDNPTPDQDRVDDIGKALGVEYDDDEELMGGDEIAERDEHRWELDPASKDDEEL